MARKIIYLAELQPYDPVAEATTTINFSDNLTDSAELGTALPYHVRLTQSFTFEQGVFDENVPGGTTVSVGSLTILNTDGRFDYLLGYNWDNRAVVIRKGYEGQSYATFETVFTGTSLECVSTGQYLTVALRDNSTKLIDPVQENKYLGTGGSEGFTDMEGKRKPLCYGRVRNLQPVLVDPALLTMQIHDGPVEDITSVWDRGNRLTKGGDYASYAALAAATVEPGFFATSKATGFLRLGAKPAGTITADADGEFYTQTVQNIGELVRQILLNKVGLDSSELNEPSFAAFAADVPYAYEGIYLIEPDITAQELMESLVASVNGFWFIDKTGLISVKQFKFRLSTATVREEDVAEMRRETSAAPVYRVSTNYSRNPTTQPLTDFPIPRATLNGYLTDNVIYVPTDASGNGGTYTYQGRFHVFLNDFDVSELAAVQFREIPDTSWITLLNDGTFTVTDPGTMLLQWAPYDASAYPATLTNRALYSRQLDNAVWVPSNATNVTVTANAGVAPDGKTTADRLQTTAASQYIRQTLTTPLHTIRTFSFYVKSNTGLNQTFILRVNAGGSTQTSATFTATSDWQRFTFLGNSAVATGDIILDLVATGAAVDLLVWQADFFDGFHLTDGGPSIETTSSPRSLENQGHGGYSYQATNSASVILEARLGEFAVQETFSIVKRLSPATSTLLLSPSARRFYLNDNGTQVTPGQTSVITASGTGVGSLQWMATTNTGGNVPLTGAGSAVTLSASDLPVSPLVQYVLVTANDTTNRIQATTKIIVQRGTDAYAAATLGALAASNETITLYYQNAAPTGNLLEIDDFWFDTNDSNKLYIYNGTAWVAATDSRVGNALSDAAGPTGYNDGKVTVFFSESSPDALAVGDLWYKPSTETLYRWSGTQWSTQVFDLDGVWNFTGSVTGSEPGATRSDNLIRNAWLDQLNRDGTLLGWSSITAVVTAPAAGDPGHFFRADTNGEGATFAAATDRNTRLPGTADKLYISAWQRGDSAALGKITFNFDIRDRRGNIQSSHSVDLVQTGTVTNNVWNLSKAEVTLTGKGNYLTGSFSSTLGAGGSYWDVTGFRVAPTELSSTLGADIHTNVFDSGGGGGRVKRDRDEILTELGEAATIAGQGELATRGFEAIVTAGNALRDDSFDSAIWNVGSGTRVARAASNGFAIGSKPFTLEIAPAAAARVADSQQFRVLPNTAYQGSIDLQRNAAGNGTVNASVFFYQSDGTTFVGSAHLGSKGTADVTAGSEPKNFTWNFTTPVAARRAYVRLQTEANGAAAGAWRFEAPSVQPFETGATVGAAWGTNVSGRPTELTDGRVAAGLDAAGDLARNITTARANTSNILRRSSGGLFTGELAADVTATHEAATIAGQGEWATTSETVASIRDPIFNALNTTILDRLYKQNLVRDVAAIESRFKLLYQRALDASVDVSALEAARTEFLNLLAGYSPAWDNFLLDTTILVKVGVTTKTWPTQVVKTGAGSMTVGDPYVEFTDADDTTITTYSWSDDTALSAAGLSGTARNYTIGFPIKKSSDVPDAGYISLTFKTQIGGATKTASVFFDPVDGHVSDPGVGVVDYGVWDLGTQWLVWLTITSDAANTGVLAEWQPARGAGTFA